MEGFDLIDRDRRNDFSEFPVELLEDDSFILPELTEVYGSL